MALQLGDIAPDFSAHTAEGAIRFHDWAGDSWVIILPSVSDEAARSKFARGWRR